jgi:hypothetical protein
MNDATAIAQFIDENITVVDEEKGPVVGAVLIHYGSQEVVVTGLKDGHELWGKSSEMAGHFDKYAKRHAAGVIGGGAQQFSLFLFRSPNGTKDGEKTASHVLPFLRHPPMGSIVGPGPAPLASEPPTVAGMTMQGQRLLELHAQGNFAMSGTLFQQMVQFMRLTVDALKEERVDARETFIAMREMAMKTAEMAWNRHMEAMKFQRNAMLQHEFLKLLPAITNAIANKEVFPLTAQDTSLLKYMHQHLSDEQKKVVLDDVAKKNTTAAASLQARFIALDEEAREDAAELSRLVRDVATGKDPMGEVTSAPRLTKKPEPEPKPEPRPDIELSRAHGTTVDAARGLVDRLVSGLPFPVDATWDGPRLHLSATEGMAAGARGTVEVGETEIVVRIGSLPLQARLWKKGVEAQLGERLDELIRG